MCCLFWSFIINSQNLFILFYVNSILSCASKHFKEPFNFLSRDKRFVTDNGLAKRREITHTVLTSQPLRRRHKARQNKLHKMTQCWERSFGLSLFHLTINKLLFHSCMVNVQNLDMCFIRFTDYIFTTFKKEISVFILSTMLRQGCPPSRHRIMKIILDLCHIRHVG